MHAATLRAIGITRSINIPPITEAQAEALVALHFTSEKYAVALGSIKAISSMQTI